MTEICHLVKKFRNQRNSGNVPLFRSVTFDHSSLLCKAIAAGTKTRGDFHIYT